MPDDRKRPAPKWHRLPPKLQLNCPYCGKPVTHVPSDGPTSYYQCDTDGLLKLPPDGDMRKATDK
jgi:hypothetical protein